MKRLFNIILLTVLFLTSFTVKVEAHRLQPAYLEISEQSSGKFSILWKVPYVGGRPMNIYPQLPSSCTNLTEPVIQSLASGAIERWLVDCGSSGMINETIVIDGLSSTQTDIPLALLFFNVGVEVGQLVFVAGVLTVTWLIQKMKFRWPLWVEQAPAYVIGSLAAFWFIQRTVLFW